MQKTACSLSPIGPTPAETLNNMTHIAMFAALVGAGAFIHVPFGPAHISLQTMMVMLAGFVLGPRRALYAMALYLACGFIGLPMFGRGKAGPASFIGPTVGFLAGFPAGAAIAGMSTWFGGNRKRRVAAMIAFGLFGTIALLALGGVGLRLTIMPDWRLAMAAGVLPYIVGDTLKMLAAVAVKEAFFPDKPADRRNGHA